MWSMLLTFKKIKSNQYALVPIYAKTTYAYMVNYQEKKALEDILYLTSLQSVIIFAVCSIPVFTSPSLGLSFAAMLYLMTYCYYKQCLHRVIGSRKKIHYKSEPRA